MADQHSDEHVNTSNVDVKSSEPKTVADQRSDETLKSKADKLSDAEGATTSNVTVESSGSTVEINIKTLDSQLHSFHVDRNVYPSLIYVFLSVLLRN